MCTSQNQQIIDSVIADFIARKQAFTAFDISKEAQSRGANERHRDMRNYIHDVPALQQEVSYGEYKKTQIDLGQNVTPFLYHHETFDPNTYQPTNGMSLVSTSSVQASASPPPVAASNSTSSSTPSTPRNDNGDGTFNLSPTLKLLTIPTKLVRACGLNAGETAFLSKDGTKLVLSKNDPGSGKARCIEHNGDLRLSKTTLSEAGIVSTAYKIENAVRQTETVVEISAA